jgi:hypothetical protein
MSAQPKTTKRRAAHASTKAKRGRVEPYPKMVAAALRTIHNRDGAEAFEHVARLTLRSVAIEFYAKRGRAVFRDELKALGYLVR